MVEGVSLLPLSAAVLSAALAMTAGVAPSRESLRVRFFLYLNISTFLWSSTYFIQLNWGAYADPSLAPFGTPDYALLWLTALGVAGAPTYWFLFAAADAHSGLWTGRGGITLAHVPAAFTVLVSVTNPWHHLFLRPAAAGAVEDGPLAFPHYVFTFLLVGAGIYYLVRQAWSRRTSNGRRQAFILGAASMLPMVGGLVSATQPITGVPVPVNLTPVLFPVLNLVLAYEVVYRGLGDIVPLTTLSSIMDNTDVHLAYLDTRFRFLSVNQAFVRRSGHSEPEILGKEYSSLFPDPDREERFEEARATGRPAEGHAEPSLFKEAPGAAPTYWDWTLSPVRDETGEVQGFVLSLADVTRPVRESELDRTLTALAARVHAAFASDAALREAVTEAASALGVETSSLVVRRDGEWRILQGCERPDATWESFDADDFPHMARALRDERPVAIDDTLVADGIDPHLMRALGLRAVLAAPIVSVRDAIGVVAFGMRSVPVRFDEPEVDFSRRLASALALALENARLYEGERRIAETLQESMLGVPEKVAGVEYSHIYRSATEAARVGGDFYDVFELDDGRVAFLMGDVSGHGIEAAVLTSLIKNTVLGQTFEHRSPGPVLAKTNDLVQRRTEAEMFVTAFFGVLGPESGGLRYSRAGHPPPLVVAPDGGLSELAAGSPVLGVIAGMTYEETEVVLGAGDVLLMYTDGLTEAHRGSEMFGEERLGGLLVGMAGGTPSEIVETLFEEVTAFTSGKLADDLALLAFRLAAVGDRECRED